MTHILIIIKLQLLIIRDIFLLSNIIIKINIKYASTFLVNIVYYSSIPFLVDDKILTKTTNIFHVDRIISFL